MSSVCAISVEQPLDRLSRNCAQFVTRFGRKFGVERQHLDGESHLVDDALTRPVSAGEQFKVLNPVVGADAVDVMDGFVRAQVASDALLHDVSVLKYRNGFLVRVFSHAHPQVSVAPDKGFRDAVGVEIKKLFAVPRTAAFGTTDDLAPVDRSAGAPRQSHQLSAVDAVFVPRVVGISTADCAALKRAVQRVLAEFLVIAAEFSGVTEKRLAALFARKFSSLDSLAWATVLSFVRAVAGVSAELTRSVAVLGGKLHATLLTLDLNCHFRLLKSVWYQYSNSIGVSTVNEEGFA